MQAIEFETHLEDGVIHLPVSYQHWQEGKKVKVILLVNESNGNQTKQPSSIKRHAGKISLTQDPLEFQKGLRDEWA